MCEISCKNCPKTYIGETGIFFFFFFFFFSKQDRLNIDKNLVLNSTPGHKELQSKSSTSEIHKSAIAEHVASSNHVIGWD